MIPTVHTPQPAPSARARELSSDLSKTIHEFKRRHPETRPDEVQLAIRLAVQENTQFSSGAAIALLLAFVILIMVAGLVYL